MIKADENGDSFITCRDYDMNLKKHVRSAHNIGVMSDAIAVSSLKLRETPGDYEYDYHCAPVCQFIVNLNNSVHITTTQNQDNILIDQGCIFAVEDVTGKGHFSQSVNGLPRNSLFIPYTD